MVEVMQVRWVKKTSGDGLLRDSEVTWCISERRTTTQTEGKGAHLVCHKARKDAPAGPVLGGGCKVGLAGRIGGPSLSLSVDGVRVT